MNTAIPKRTYIFAFGQTLNLTCAVMSVTMAAVVGSMLAPFPALATIPYGMQFLAVFVTTFPMARLMDRYGRATGFRLGALALFVSGIVGWLAITRVNFSLLIVSHALLGVYIASANFNRFAATDGVSQVIKPRVMALVVGAGLVAAIVGPVLTANLRIVGSYSPFAMAYLFFAAVALLALGKSLFVSNKSVVKSAPGKSAEPLTRDQRWCLAIAMVGGGFGYGVMNLLMMQGSLYMHGLSMRFELADAVLQAHVIAMFLPSFVSGRLIARFKPTRMLVLGYLLLLISCVAGFGQTQPLMLGLSLVVLGVAWNFLYVAGSSLVLEALKGRKDIVRWQGVNDTVIALAATLGALLPAVLYSMVGWNFSLILIAVTSICLMAATLSFWIRENVHYAYAD